MRVAALYRYPVKGFSCEQCASLTVLETGRIAGDRVLGFRFANAAAVGDVWGIKHEFVALVNTPGIAPLEVTFDHQRLRLRVSFQGSELVDEALDDVGRKRIAATLEAFVLNLDENPLSAHPERLPIRMVGDGRTPLYQDNVNGYITLHSRESLAAVAAAANTPDLDELRFRSNIAIEGVDAWEEQTWLGRKIRIGEVEFKFAAAKGRCLATHANPATGKRDLPVMQTLQRAYPKVKPTFAIAMLPDGHGGTIHVGDKIEVVG